MIVEKGPEVRLGDIPARLDPLVSRVLIMGLMVYEAVAHPLRESIVTWNSAQRSVSVARRLGI